MGTPAERQRSEYIAAAVPGAQVPDRQPLDSMARLVAGASFVVGVDTGLVHLAAALGVPLVAIFVSSKPGLTGPMGQGPIAIVGGDHAMPSVVDVTGALDRSFNAAARVGVRPAGVNRGGEAAVSRTSRSTGMSRMQR